MRFSDIFGRQTAHLMAIHENWHVITACLSLIAQGPGVMF